MERLRSWLLTDSPESAFHARCQRFYLSWRAFRTNPIAMIGLLIIATLVLVAALAPLLTQADGTEQYLADRLMAPGAEHWFGTDELGRDIYERIIWGSRITLYIVGLVGIKRIVRQLIAMRLTQDVRHFVRVVLVHLAAHRFDVELFGHFCLIG